MFGAEAFELDRIGRFALGAFARGIDLVVAEVAGESVLRAMVGEREVAVGAFDDVAAIRTNLHPVGAAPIEEEERLLAHGEPFFDAVQDFRAKVGEAARALHRPFHVDDLNAGHRGSSSAGV